MRAGHVGPQPFTQRRPGKPVWLDGHLHRWRRDRGLLFAWRGYPMVRHGPIRQTGWYVPVEDELCRHPYGPFSSRLAAQQWRRRWIDSPSGRLRFRDWQRAGSWTHDDPIPRRQSQLRKSGPTYGFEPPLCRSPRHNYFPHLRGAWDVRRLPRWKTNACESRRRARQKPIRIFWSEAAISRTGSERPELRDEVYERIRVTRLFERRRFTRLFEHPETEETLLVAQVQEFWNRWEARVWPYLEDTIGRSERAIYWFETRTCFRLVKSIEHYIEWDESSIYKETRWPTTC